MKLMLQSFEFTTAKISDTGQISYFEKQGKYLDVELDSNTVLTLVLASTETLESEDNIHSPFLISKYPITQKQWYKVMKSFQYGGNLGFKKPVMASWIDAMEFCDRLSQKGSYLGKGFTSSIKESQGSVRIVLRNIRIYLVKVLTSKR
jgi:hypothetical protein